MRILTEGGLYFFWQCNSCQRALIISKISGELCWYSPEKKITEADRRAALSPPPA